MSAQVEQHPAGFVGYDKRGHFVHYCHCGEWGAFGYDVFLRLGKKGIDKPGKWYCGWHRPDRQPPDRRDGIYWASHDNDEFVTLTNAEINHCARFGMEMRKTSIAQGHKDKRGFTGTDELKMRMQAIGAVCEGAICRLFGWPFKTMQAQSFKVADLPGNIQVRLISHEHYGLRVYPDDDPAWRVVGVVIPQGRERKPYRLPGWISAIEAKDRADWAIAPNGRPPVVAVPQQHLRPLTELRELLRAEGHL